MYLFHSMFKTIYDFCNKLLNIITCHQIQRNQDARFHNYNNYSYIGYILKLSALEHFLHTIFQ